MSLISDIYLLQHNCITIHCLLFSDLRPKGRGRPQRILLGVWPDEHIRGVIRAVVFRDSHQIKDEPHLATYPRLHVRHLFKPRNIPNNVLTPVPKLMAGLNPGKELFLNCTTYQIQLLLTSVSLSVSKGFSCGEYFIKSIGAKSGK